MRDDGLLAEVLMALGKAELVEQILVDERKRWREKMIVYGATEGKRVYVNPMHNKRRIEVVSTLIHEGIHRVRPSWTELGVRRAEKRLMRKVNDDITDSIFRVYRQAVKRLRGVREL
jgi:hypothetical protein